METISCYLSCKAERKFWTGKKLKNKQINKTNGVTLFQRNYV